MRARFQGEQCCDYQYLAAVLYHLGDDAGFRSAAEKALELNPNHAEVLATVGWCYCSLDMVEGGETLFEKAVRLNPSTPPWYHGGLVVCAINARDAVAARRHADFLRWQGDIVAVLFPVAIARLEGRGEEADRMLEEVAQQRSQNIESIRELVEAWRLTDRIEGLIFDETSVSSL